MSDQKQQETVQRWRVSYSAGEENDMYESDAGEYIKHSDHERIVKGLEEANKTLQGELELEVKSANKWATQAGIWERERDAALEQVMMLQGEKEEFKRCHDLRTQDWYRINDLCESYRTERDAAIQRAEVAEMVIKRMSTALVNIAVNASEESVCQYASSQERGAMALMAEKEGEQTRST